VNANFVPVALKAGLVNNPPPDVEGRLYHEIGRSRPAPQGICIVNSAGKVLAWSLMFDDDNSVLAFLGHCRKRFAQFPDAKRPFPAERYMKFPSQKLADVEDNGRAPVIVERHPEGQHCPASPGFQKGTILVRLFGRALDKDGRPVADTRRQEHYVEDRFHIPLDMQDALARTLRDAGSKRLRLPSDLFRLLVSHAYLGQLDVNPVSAPGGEGNLKTCEFWAQKIEGTDGNTIRVHIKGKSEAVGHQGRIDQGVDGRIWQHEVNLTWEGILEMKKDRMSRLLVVARGSEKLKWGNKAWNLTGQGDVTRLPAGHAIDLSCAVRYGIIGEPVADEETTRVATGGPPGIAPSIPEEARKHLLRMLGGPFLVFQARAQDELRLSDKQRTKLLEQLPIFVQETMKTFEGFQQLRPDEREKAMQFHRQKCQEQLTALLKETLNAKQLKRLEQMELRQEGLFNLGRPEIAQELKMTDEQRHQFMGVVQEMQKKIEPLMQQVQSGGNPREIGPKVMQIRKVCEGRIAAILTDTQQKQWQKMLGKPFALSD
jgi:hypothetical protein